MPASALSPVPLEIVSIFNSATTGKVNIQKNILNIRIRLAGTFTLKIFIAVLSILA
jgi:hypothetical protein